MESGGIEDGQTSIPLLLSENPSESSDSSSHATAVVVLSTLVAVFGSYVFGSAVGYSSPAQSGIMDDLGLSVAEYSVFGSISTVGAMLGAVMSGKLADLFGRRGTMGFAEVFCIIGWLGIVLAKVPVYIAEITPKNLRGGFTAVNQLMICIGVSLTYLVGTFISWRILALIGFSGKVGTWAMVVVQVPMTMVGVLLMDKSGRRVLLMISAAGTCLGCFLVGLSYLLQDLQVWNDFSPILALGGVLVFTGSFSLGVGGIPWVIMSEIFPINMKGLAGSLVTVVNWLGTWIISYTFNFLMDWSSDGTFFIFASVSGLTILFVYKLVPETKGRTLEEIQASMNPFTAKK